MEALETSATANESIELGLDRRNWGLLLAKYVAQEKARDIKNQRPAIKKLGPNKLEKMVRQIFEDLDADEYEQKKVADQFGLSTATLSRFAGSNWREMAPEGTFVPDLWRNTAQVISQIPVFRDVAQEAGMLGLIKAIQGGSHE